MADSHIVTGGERGLGRVGSRKNGFGSCFTGAEGSSCTLLWALGFRVVPLSSEVVSYDGGGEDLLRKHCFVSTAGADCLNAIPIRLFYTP